MRISCLSFLFLALILPAIGCGDGKRVSPTGNDVSGKVTLDGEPLKNGAISFQSDPPDGFPAASATILNGAFHLKVRAGKMKVEIRSPVDTGKKDETNLPIMEEAIPEKYNTATTLSTDIPAAGTNTLTYELKK